MRYFFFININVTAQTETIFFLYQVLQTDLEIPIELLLLVNLLQEMQKILLLEFLQFVFLN